MTDQPLLLTAAPTPSPARTRPASRPPLRLGLVQERWHPDPSEHEETLARGVAAAAAAGARIVCLQELTLSRYFAVTPEGPAAAGAEPEDLESGPTVSFARRAAAGSGAFVHASLYERSPGGDGLGFNTAIVVAPDGRILSRTRKPHIPVTAGYYEDRYFRPGPADRDPFPLTVLPAEGGAVTLGCPTCWDQWFPELARAYSLAGAEVLIYPTAIGSEPDHPTSTPNRCGSRSSSATGSPTEPSCWRSTGSASRVPSPSTARASSPTRTGGSSSRPRATAPAVLVADLDLDQRRDWLELFPFLRTRRPDAYGCLVAPSGEAGEAGEGGGAQSAARNAGSSSRNARRRRPRRSTPRRRTGG